MKLKQNSIFKNDFVIYKKDKFFFFLNKKSFCFEIQKIWKKQLFYLII